MFCPCSAVPSQGYGSVPGFPAPGGIDNVAMQRLGGLQQPGAPGLFDQQLQVQTLLTQMLTLLLGLLLNNNASGSQAGQSALGSTSGGGGSSSASDTSSAGGSSSAGGTTAGGTVDPSTVKDKDGGGGLSGHAKAGLEQAHRFGLPLVSGKRSGNGKSDHDHGDAIDVGTLPIGVASSNGGTPQMREFAEFMRQEGKAGRSNVKYIIRDGQIASAKGNWEWRPYTYPGKSQGELDALKRSNPGEYNRLQHFDHVHVSFN